MRREPVNLWTRITRNPDGSPLFGFALAGPVGILIGIGYLVWGLFY